MQELREERLQEIRETNRRLKEVKSELPYYK
jgi:hypothetical protein